VIYFFYSDRPSVIEPLIRFAYERAELETALTADDSLSATLGGRCGHILRNTDPGYHVEISTSGHGFFAILTSANRTTVKMLHQDAKRSVQLGQPVRF